MAGRGYGAGSIPLDDLLRFPILNGRENLFRRAARLDLQEEVPVPGDPREDPKDPDLGVGRVRGVSTRKMYSTGFSVERSATPWRVTPMATTGFSRFSTRAWGNATPSLKNVDPSSSRFRTRPRIDAGSPIPPPATAASTRVRSAISFPPAGSISRCPGG